MKNPSLKVLATPIGNLEDLSPRAKTALAEADLIACEDTRVTGKLLSVLGIEKKPFVSYFDQVEKKKAASIVDRLVAENLNLVLVSDAGTPCISDPGYHLVAEARSRGIEVSPIPGPTAAMALLSVSGLPCHRFMFIGFLPPKANARQKEVESWTSALGSIILYESPRRVLATIQLIEEIHPEALVCIGREITKLYEEIRSFSVKEAAIWLQAHSNLKGEFAIVVNLPEKILQEDDVKGNLRADVIAGFRAGKSLKDLLKEMKDSGLSRSDLYGFLLEVKNSMKEELGE